MTNPKTSQTAAKDAPTTPAGQGDDATPEQDGASAAKEQVAEPAPAGKQGAPSTKAGGKAGAKSGTKPKRDVLLVSARGESFRRAGLGFGRQPRIVFVDQLSDAQVEAIKTEKHLVVVEDQVEDERPSEGAQE